MSYRALLFCPDEAAARLVTQVLSELEFTVELSFEPFVTVQKLAAEAFDAVVVDCANEENAALLFKGARNSSVNHSSLCVAVVESQMGVAKAFRIGANLVLTKPINIEQSKGTLRVARGLLRKGEAKPRAASEPVSITNTATSPMPSSLVLAPPEATSSIAATAASSASAAAAKAVTVPSSLFEAQQAAPPRTEPETTPQPNTTPDFVISKPIAAEETLTPQPKTASDRFAGRVSTSGAAAAPALAPESPRPLPSSFTSKLAGAIKTAAPLASQDTIVPQKRFPEPVAVRVPTFSSYALPVSRKPRDGNKMFWWFLCMVILAPTGYFGWQKLQPLRYIHRFAPVTNAVTAPPVSQPATEASPSSGSSVNQEPQNTLPATSGSNLSNEPIVPNSAPEGFPTKETIEIEQPAEEADANITVVPKPEPLQVKQKPAVPNAQAQLTPPSIVLPDSERPNSAIEGIVSANVIVPRVGQGAMQISQGVTQGLLIKKIAPRYPPSAMQLRKQGAVDLMATISKIGDVTKVEVLRGDAILAKAASDAVRQWKYRPFLLNNEPVEIETQITINFKLPR
jgi:periplasmic protein TonB